MSPQTETQATQTETQGERDRDRARAASILGWVVGGRNEHRLSPEPQKNLLQVRRAGPPDTKIQGKSPKGPEGTREGFVGN
jgi:hypothetical protein